MLSSDLYIALDKELSNDRLKARLLVKELNTRSIATKKNIQHNYYIF